MKKSKFKNTLILFFCTALSVSSLTSCNFGKKDKDDNKNIENHENDDISNKTDSNKNNENDEQNENDENNEIVITDSNDKNNPVIVPPTVSIRPPTPAVPNTKVPAKDTKDGLGDYWFELNAVVSKASKYYFENFSKTRLISYNGSLYNKSNASFIDTAYLYEYEGLNDRFRWVNADILLMHPSDLREFGTLDVNVSGNELTVFGARKHPSANKYLISSPNGKCGIITLEEYRSLISKYMQSHGKIYELNPNSEAYSRILKFINMYEGGKSEFYPRNIICDDKYVFVTLSTTSNTADLKQYILKKEGNVYKVMMDGLEKEPRLAIAVNKKLPDYNLDLLPDFSVYSHRNNLKSSFNDVIEFLSDGQYVKNYEIRYIAGTKEYCYVITTSNVKYLLKRSGETWKAQRVASGYEAKNIMSNDYDAPLFIVLDE